MRTQKRKNLADTGGCQERQLGFGHDAAADGLAEAVTKWAVPFLKAWMNAGQQPNVSDADREQIHAELTKLRSGGDPPEGYSWLPELLWRLAESIRFNRRNLVNIHPAPHVPAALAGLVVALQNPNNIVEAVSAQTTALERSCVEWMAEHLAGFDKSEAWGNIVSGGTVANMTALLVARDYCYRKLTRPRPADVRQRGLYGLPAGVVVTTAGAHYSVRKALWFLGMGDENVVTIPVAYDEQTARAAARDGQYIKGITREPWAGLIHDCTHKDRERGNEELEAFYAGASQPFSLQPLNSEIFKALYACFEYGTPLIAYVFTVGTVDTGTIELPDSVALNHLRQEDIYVHADAAMGGFGLLHSKVKSRAEGLEKVHSITVDGHKLGHLAYPNGAILFRGKGLIHEILHEAPYLEGLAPTLEGSRPGSHVAALWAAIEDMGRTARYEQWLGRIFDFVDKLVAALETCKELQILNRVDMNVLAIAPRPRKGESRQHLNAITAQMQKQIAADTSKNAFLVNEDRKLAGIMVRDRPESSELVDIRCLRAVVANPAVELNEVGELVSYLRKQLAVARRAVGT